MAGAIFESEMLLSVALAVWRFLRAAGPYWLDGFFSGGGWPGCVLVEELYF